MEQQILTAGCDAEDDRGECLSGTARLWDLTGNELVRFEGHKLYVDKAVINSPGDRIVTIGCEEFAGLNCLSETVRLWDLSGNELARLEGHAESVRSALFSPDGQQISNHES